MSSLKYLGNAERMSVNLGAAYTAGSGTITLTAGHGALLPSAGDFWLVTRVGTYCAFKVTARSSDTLTVTAGQDGTTDTSLSLGTELNWSLTASALDQFRADLSQTGLVASMPSGPKVGDIYNPSDSLYQYRFNGSIWEPWGPLFKMTPLDTTGWSSAGAGSFGALSGVVQITDTKWLYKACPATPYTVTAALAMNFAGPTSNYLGGLFWGASGGNKIVHGVGMVSGAHKWAMDLYSAAYGWSSSIGNDLLGFAPILFLRLTDDGSNKKAFVSYNSISWVQVYSTTHSGTITPAEIGIQHIAPTGRSGQMLVLSYKEE